MHTVTSGLEDEIAAEAEADQAFIAALRGTPITPEAAPAVAPPRLRPAPRSKITLFRRDSKRRKTLRVGSVSMKARFWKRRW